MNDQTDSQLLCAYAEHHSEPAFAELVRRHVDFVYSAARRMVCDSHLAQDVTQGVFVALAKNATQLTDRPVLSGWLHRTAQNIAAQTVRTDVRRRAREQEAATMNELLSAEPDAVWEHIAPHLDAALGELSEPDRDALLLRYFERKSAREMAQTLGISDEAAQKRVSRAVERLREFFAKRGVTVGASSLVVVISANAVQAAPVGLAVTISTATAIAGTSLATTATVTATKAIVMTTLQKTVITATIAAAVGTGIYQAHQASTLQTQVQTLQQQQSPLAEQIQKFEQEREDATRQLAALRDDNERLNRNTAELLKLRGEVSRLRNNSEESAKSNATDANDPMQIQMKSWLARVNQVKQRFEEIPGSKIPELEFLLEHDWLDATKVNHVKTDDDYRKAMAGLRVEAATRFGMLVQGALREYFKANDGQFPSDLSQLEPYFKTPAESAVLQRYQIVPAIYLGGDVEQSGLGEWAITQKTALDEQVDLRIAIGKDVINLGFRMQTDSALDSVISAFAAANNGRLPKKIQDLKPYVSTPAEQTAFEKRTTFDRNRRNPSAVPVINDAYPSQYE